MQRRQTPFDLEGGGPLVASALLSLAADDHIWTLTVHHILADGASLSIIGRELGAIYPALLAGADPGLPEPPIQYGDFAVWYDTADHPQHDEDLQYWLDRLAGVPPLELHTDLPRPARKAAPAAEVTHLVDADLADRVDALTRALRCTRFMVLLATLRGCWAPQWTVRLLPRGPRGRPTRVLHGGEHDGVADEQVPGLLRRPQQLADQGEEHPLGEHPQVPAAEPSSARLTRIG